MVYTDPWGESSAEAAAMIRQDWTPEYEEKMLEANVRAGKAVGRGTKNFWTKTLPNTVKSIPGLAKHYIGVGAEMVRQQYLSAAVTIEDVKSKGLVGAAKAGLEDAEIRWEYFWDNQAELYSEAGRDIKEESQKWENDPEYALEKATEYAWDALLALALEKGASQVTKAKWLSKVDEAVPDVADDVLQKADAPERPTWQQAEVESTADLEEFDFEPQKSFLEGEEVNGSPRESVHESRG